MSFLSVLFIYVLLQGVAATQVDAIISQSSLPRPVWDFAVEVLNKYEKIKLEDKKPQCGLKNTKPEF